MILLTHLANVHSILSYWIPKVILLIQLANLHSKSITFVYCIYKHTHLTDESMFLHLTIGISSELGHPRRRRRCSNHEDRNNKEIKKPLLSTSAGGAAQISQIHFSK